MTVARRLAISTGSPGAEMRVPALMLFVEGALDGIAVARCEMFERDIDGDDVLLADITHVHRALDQNPLRPHGGGLYRLVALAFQVGKDAVEHIERRRAQIGEPGADKIVTQVREQHAKGGEVARRVRNDDAANADLAGDGGGVQRTGAAIGDEREIASVESARGRDRLHGIGHFGRGDAQYAVGGGDDVESERRRYLVAHRRRRRRGVERHLATEKPAGAETAQHQIGIRHRRIGAAATVAGRSRFGARALWPDQ